MVHTLHTFLNVIIGRAVTKISERVLSRFARNKHDTISIIAMEGDQPF